MGLVHVTARVSTLTRRKYLEAEFLVDTGALNCTAPGSALRRIGVRPEGKEVFELAKWGDGGISVCFRTPVVHGFGDGHAIHLRTGR